MSEPSDRAIRRQGKEQCKLLHGLLKKNRKRVSQEVSASIEAAVATLRTAVKGKDRAGIVAGLKVAEELYDAHLAQYRKSPFREYFEPIGIALIVALFLRTFVVEAFRIPSSSMIPTLAVGDFLFVNKLAYGIRLPYGTELVQEWSQPERGDVIVFVYPCDPSLDYIKRVIGLPGDAISADINGFVTINGKAVNERRKEPFYEKVKDYSGTDSGNNCGKALTAFASELGPHKFHTLHCGPPVARAASPTAADWSDIADFRRCQADLFKRQLPPFPWTVPPGHVFVMGDNRNNSADSRFWGFVPIGHIKGKAMFIWLSWDGSHPWSDFTELVRWDRMFRGVHKPEE